MTVQIGSLEFHLIVQDNEGKPHPTTLWFLSEEDKKKTSFSGSVMWKRLHAMKSLLRKPPNMPVFTCVCVCMLVFPHLHVACRIQKVMPGFPSHFPFHVLKQGLLLNPELIESSNLTPQSPEDSRLTSQALGLQVASMALNWVLRKRTLVLVFAGQELRPLNHPLTNSHAAILVWENRLLYTVCPLMEIKTSYSHARQALPPPSGTRSPKVLSKSGKLMRSIMVYRYDNAIIKPNTMLT